MFPLFSSERPGTLISRGVIRGPLVLTRSHSSGARASALDSGGTGLGLYLADAPRFTDQARRLLSEGPGTNTIRNPLCEGAIAGSPGTFPTHWGVFGNGAGLTWNVVGFGTENGVQFVDLRLSGTSSSVAQALIRADQLYPVAAIGEIWTHSVYIRQVGGSLAGIGAGTALFVTEWTSGGVFVRQSFSAITLNAPTMLGSRQAVTSTLSGATTGQVGSQIGISPQIGVPIDCTLRVAAPQLKQLPFADTPSFPPAGTPGASTRGADLINPSLASLGISANGACTILWSGVVPNFIVGSTHTIACLDDGSVNNRFTMRVDQASGQLQAQRSLAAASTTANAGAVTAGAAIKGGMALNGSGRAAVSLNGGATAAVTGGPSSGLTHLRLGSLFGGAAPMWGETRLLRILPLVSDGELQSLTGAMP